MTAPKAINLLHWKSMNCRSVIGMEKVSLRAERQGIKTSSFIDILVFFVAQEGTFGATRQHLETMEIGM